MDSSADVVLLTRSEGIADAVSATAAALRATVEVVGEASELATDWEAPAVVVVGGDQAAVLAALAPRRRARVYLVGFEAEPLVGWSVPLGAEVICLPTGEALLSQALGAHAGPAAPVVAVAGGHGGSGASTLAAGLSFAAARKGRSCALVDLDPHGGGLDLVVGAERQPGWRWPRLLSARGEVGDIREFLPSVDGVNLVSAARPPGGERLEIPDPSAVESVIDSLARHHDLVVLDVGRAANSRPIRAVTSTLLTVAATVRGVAAAAAGSRFTPGASLVVKRASEAVAPHAVADMLGLRLAGVLPHDRGLSRSAAVGLPPGRSPHRRWARAVAGVLDFVWEEAFGDG